MSEQTPLKIVHFPDKNGLDKNGSDKNGSLPEQGTEGEHEVRSLSSLDKIVLMLLSLVLLLAALSAGSFSTPHFIAQAPPQDLLSRLQLLSVSLIGILVGLALVIAVCREWQRPVAIGPINGLAGGGVLLAVWAGVTLLVHGPLSNLGLNAWTTLLAALTVGGLVSRLGRDRSALVILLLVVVGAGSLAAAFGVREYLEHWKQGVTAHRVFGTFNSPNFLAGYVLLTLPLTLSCFVAARERLTRLLLGLGLCLQTMCLLMTGSRAAVGMLFVVVVVWLLMLLRADLLHGRGKVIGAGLALMALSTLLASTPLLMRVASVRRPGGHGTQVGTASIAAAADTQSHSGKFRQYTWIGTLHMAGANPLAGTGIGSYETAYLRYATTAFTAHAHNSFLQWTAETGVPGAIFLLVVLASSTAFGTYVLFLNVPRRRAGIVRQKANRNLPFTPAPSPPLPHGFAEPRLVLAGLLAAVLSTALDSLFDSEWYIVATALTLSAIIGLLAAVARDLAPLATQRPRPLSHPMLAACAVVALLLLWRGGTTYFARAAEIQGLEANFDFRNQMANPDSRAADSLHNAIDSYSAATTLDPFDPELSIVLSNLDETSGKSDQAEQALRTAVKIAPNAKDYYLLGQYYKRQALRNINSLQGTNGGVTNSAVAALSGMDVQPTAVDAAELKKAMDAFNQARERDPHNLSNLRTLAETNALLGNESEAILVYRDMAALESTPLGTVRAIPEIIETDFAFAHARLATALYKQHNLADALTEYRKADDLLQIYWTNRHYELYQNFKEDWRHKLIALYQAVLDGWQTALTQQGSNAAPGVSAQIRTEQAALQKGQQDDEAAAAKAQAEQNAAQKTAQDSPQP